MKILQIEIYKLKIKLKEPFVISLGPLTHAENIVVVIRTNEGINGFGECSPFRTIHGESMETCFVVAQDLAKILIGKNPLQIADNKAFLDKVIYGNACIKSAFDMALYDIAAQNANLPLYKFLGGKIDKTIQTDYTISLGDADKMVADAIQIKKKGFEIIKVKLGESKEKDVERIKLIREAVGDKIPLRIDANQGWETDEAIEILKALQQYKIKHCEEPIARWNFMELPKIRKYSPIQIMADETCCDHHDARRLIDLQACDLFNIKLGKSAGIINALEIIKLAEKANIKLQLGGFLESRLGFTATAHLALTSDNIIHYDFDTPLMFEEDPVIGGIKYKKNGKITLPETAGLGAKIDESYLQKLPHVII